LKTVYSFSWRQTYPRKLNEKHVEIFLSHRAAAVKDAIFPRRQALQVLAVLHEGFSMFTG